MIIEWNRNRAQYQARSSYNERFALKNLGWRWEPTLRLWFTALDERAKPLAQHAIGEARERLQNLDAAAREAIAASTAADAAIEIPAPAGKAFRPYQRAGIAYAMRTLGAGEGRGVLIADEMGLGKTIQAIGIANLARPSRVLVICPASLRLNWLREWRAWSTLELRVRTLDAWPFTTAGMCLIVSYDSVKKWHPQIAQTEWDLVVMDEAHLVKDASTRRAKSIFGERGGDGKFEAIRHKALVMLTGTPIVNRPAELWPLVHALDPRGLGERKTDFDKRFATLPDKAMLADLHSGLRSRFMVRRLKADVLKELPAKTRQVILVEPPHLARILAAEKEALEAARAKFAEVRELAAGMPHGDAVRKLTAARGIAMSEMSRIRHDTAVAKLPAVIDHIWDALFEAEKLVIFAHHHDVVDALASEFNGKAVVLTGRTPEAARNEAVGRFQASPDARLFIGSIRAAGLGLTLTAASTAIFAELDWTPAMMMQAEDRLHRIGQHDAVLVQHLVINGSIDAKMAHILIDKQEVMDRALDGGPRDQRDILEEVMR